MILYVTKFREDGHWVVLVLSLEDQKPIISLCRTIEYRDACRIMATFKLHQRRKVS
jgi:hypothetical protein